MAVFSRHAQVVCREPDCIAYVHPLGPPPPHTTKRVEYCALGRSEIGVHVLPYGKLSVAGLDGEVLSCPLGFLEIALDDTDGMITIRSETPNRMVLGPLRPEAGEAAATAIRTLADRAYVLEPPPSSLENDPRAFHGRVVSVSGRWDHGFERSAFHGAWLYVPDGLAAPRDGSAVSVTGLWLSQEGRRYGHLGGSSAALLAYEIR